jgi:hypothetical protein
MKKEAEEEAKKKEAEEKAAKEKAEEEEAKKGTGGKMDKKAIAAAKKKEQEDAKVAKKEAAEAAKKKRENEVSSKKKRAKRNLLYEGSIQEEKGVPCIASFPWRFEDEWSEIVALGTEEDDGSVSVACVRPRYQKKKKKKKKKSVQHVNDPATGRCYCESIGAAGSEHLWALRRGCAWFEDWKLNCYKARAYDQVFQVYYFPGQVGQGKVSWEDLPKHALLRNKVLSAWPKDDETGGPKKLQPAEEAAYLAGLSEEERSTVVGLGGSQKAQVAWLDKHEIPYEELDVGEFKLRKKFTRKATYSLFGGQVHTDPLLDVCVLSFHGSAYKFDFQVSAC